MLLADAMWVADSLNSSSFTCKEVSMQKKLLCVLCVLVMAYLPSSAQNARVDALGGSSIVDDIINIVRNPADVTDYADNVQATATGAAFGAAIVTKSVGDMLTIGALANGGSVLQSNYYATAAAQVNLAGGTALTGTPGPIPRLLVGLDVDPLALGLAVFFEAERNKSVTTVDPPESKATISKRITNIGALLSANIEMGDAVLSPLFGLSLPRINGLNETDDGLGNIVTTEQKSQKGMMVKGGAELGVPMLDMDWTFGMFYTFEGYQFVTKAAGTDTEGPEYPNHVVSAYLGFVTEIAGDVLLATEYGLTANVTKVKTESSDGLTPPTITNVDNGTTNYTHNVRVGIEKAIEGVWIFDALTPRAGLRWQILDQHTKNVTELSGAATSETVARTNSITGYGQVAPTLGLGVTKGAFAFDVLVNMGAFAGVAIGPAVVEGTLTLDFGESSSGTSSSGTSGYDSSTPASEPSYTPAPSYDSGTGGGYESTPSTETGDEGFSF
jgi:hypothetical protein